ncbi:MAG: hypothetical protein R3Y39_00015 [Rikenellaceae bacterium]
MSLVLLIFGALSGCFLSILVGMIGSNRRIGFGWPFFLSLIFTPIVGLLVALLSETLPYGEQRRWGCLGAIIGILGFLMLIPIILAIMGLSLAALL